MRILAVTNMYPTPEEPFVGTFVEQQVQGLRQAGVEIEVLYLNRRRDGTQVYAQAGERALERARDFRPTVVHVMYGGVMADRVTRAVRDVPIVVSFCGSDLLGERLSGWKRKLIAGWGVWSSWRAARRARGIVVKSKNLERALPRSIDRAKVRIIPNGVNLDRFKPMDREECRKQTGWDVETFRAVFSANFGDLRKRPWVAEAAVKCLNARGIKAALFRLEGIPHEQVPVWLNASDCVLITSLFEGSVNVVKEALACNVPVVSVDVGDVAELMDGIAGCHIASEDPEALAAAMDQVRLRRGRIAAREKMEKLSLEQVARRLCDFYEEMLAAPRVPVGV